MKRYRRDLIAALLAGSAAMPGASAGDVPLPAEAITNEIDQAALTATWWQWALSLPLEPYMDPDGRQCRLGQEGPVWFLAGTDGSFDAERRCQVPLGTYLFLPVVSRFTQTPLDAEKDQAVPGCEALRAMVDMPPAGLLRAIVRIDGVERQDLAGHRIRSADCFDPYPGISVMEGRHAPLAASDGYWLLVPPLPPGRHVLEVDAHYRSGDGFETLQRFKYELHMGALPQYVVR